MKLNCSESVNFVIVSNGKFPIFAKVRTNSAIIEICKID